jgi:hypothetical protein
VQLSPPIASPPTVPNFSEAQAFHIRAEAAAQGWTLSTEQQTGKTVCRPCDVFLFSVFSGFGLPQLIVSSSDLCQQQNWRAAVRGAQVMPRLSPEQNIVLTCQSP